MAAFPAVESAVSVVVTIQLAGSDADARQILADSVEPFTRNRSEYEVLALAVNEALFSLVTVPLTFLESYRLVPST